MQQKGFRLLSVLLAAALLIGLITAAPFTASAAGDDTHTIHVTSNLFPENQIVITDWTQYEDKLGDCYVETELKLNAPDMYLVGVQLNALTWDNTKLEYKESYNSTEINGYKRLNLFPFAIAKCGEPGMSNTFHDSNYGRVTGNFSNVTDPAEAFEDNGQPIVLVRAVFRVLDRSFADTTVNFRFEVLSLDDIDTTSNRPDPKPRYMPVNHGEINETDKARATYVTAAKAQYPLYVLGKTLTLDSGEIDVNFYIAIKDPALTADPESLTFELTWGTAGERFGVNRMTPSPQLTNRGYRVTCPVPAPAMTEPITLRILNANNEVLLTDVYSVVDYARKAKSLFSPQLKQVICDMLDFGGAAQVQMDHRLTDLASDAISEIDDSWTRTEISELDDSSTINSQVDLSAYGLQFKGATMVLTAKTAIRLYFTVQDNDVFAGTTAKVNGADQAFGNNMQNGIAMKYLEISGLKPDKVFNEQTITLQNSGESANYTYSAAKYYNSIMRGTLEKMKPVVNAMYNYSTSTDNYIKSLSNRGAA